MLEQGKRDQGGQVVLCSAHDYKYPGTLGYVHVQGDGRDTALALSWDRKVAVRKTRPGDNDDDGEEDDDDE